jgi:hypothetical protein
MSGIADLCTTVAFFNRFTLAELAGIMGNSTGAAIVVKILAKGSGWAIDIADPELVLYMGQAVTAGLLTSARSTQILNLTLASP